MATKVADLRPTDCNVKNKLDVHSHYEQNSHIYEHMTDLLGRLYFIQHSGLNEVKEESDAGDNATSQGKSFDHLEMLVLGQGHVIRVAHGVQPKETNRSEGSTGQNLIPKRFVLKQHNDSLLENKRAALPLTLAYKFRSGMIGSVSVSDGNKCVLLRAAPNIVIEVIEVSV